MTYKRREVADMLVIKLKMRPRNADHEWYELSIDGLPPIRTKLSNNKKDIHDALENKIFRQLRVRKKFFHELMDCTKSKDDYEQQVISDPYPPFDNLIV